MLGTSATSGTTARCSCDCKCSNYIFWLGLDSSYIFLLVRSAVRAQANPTYVSELLAAHRCRGQRELIISRTCWSECFSSQAPLTQVMPSLTISDLLPALLEQDDAGYEFAVPSEVDVDGREVHLDSGERSIAHVLERQAQHGDCPILVLDDEDAFDALFHRVVTGHSSILPVNSLAFVRKLFDCGAFEEVDVVRICDHVRDDLGGDRQAFMSSRKRVRKQRSLDELLTHVGSTLAERPTGTPSRPALRIGGAVE